MHDIASADLNAVMLPIPSEMRLFVFLASGRDPEMEAKWLECGGLTTFLTAPETCGVCIFRRGAGNVNFIEPFFKRAGRESNVFCFCDRSKTFFRVNQKWLDTYSVLLAL